VKQNLEQKGAGRARVLKASLLPFVFVMYAYTTAGPFGLEDQVTTSGPGMTLLYHLLIPFFWCIPVSLVAAELTTAIPVEGGFYRWSRTAFGNFWGFLAGWWNWCASFVLGGVYAVLFSDYLVFFFPSMIGWKHYAASLALIAAIAWINIRGIQLVGAVATALEIFILLPVAVLSAIAALHWRHNPFLPLTPPHVPGFQVFGVGLALGIWLYSGYEQMSSVAEEVLNPQRSYPRALALVVPLSMATYFLPTLFSLAALGNWAEWRTGYFSEAARLIGGPWLGFWMTLAAAVTNISILNATVLTGTRMPSTLAEDGYFSEALTRRHSRFGTPWIAILTSAVVYAALAVLNLAQLIKVYAWLRIAVTVVTVLSVWRLRQRLPDIPRPFRIPWGRAGIVYVVAAPVVMGVLAMLGADRFSLVWGPATLALGPVVFFLLRARRNRPAW
jgi:amino acid transporter